LLLALTAPARIIEPKPKLSQPLDKSCEMAAAEKL
jgi:hypothetical protein